MGYTPQIEFYKKRQFGDKINATFTFLRENAWPYIKQQLLIAGPLLLIVNIMMNQIGMDFLGFTEQDINADFIINMLELYGLALISNLITATVVPIVTYSYMMAYQENGPEDISTAMVLRNMGSKFFNLFGFNLISSILIIISMFFFVLPGIYVAVAFSLGSSIILFEKNNPIDALGRVFTLIKGKWWSTFGLIIIMGIIGYVVSALFSLPRTLLYGMKVFTTAVEGGDLTTFANMGTGEQALNIFFSVLETFGSILLYSLMYITLAFQYFNLVERRESRGLMNKIEGMDSVEEEDDDTF